MTAEIPKLERDLQALQTTEIVAPSVLLEVAKIVATGPRPVTDCPTDEWAECHFEHRDDRDGAPCTYIALRRVVGYYGQLDEQDREFGLVGEFSDSPSWLDFGGEFETPGHLPIPAETVDGDLTTGLRSHAPGPVPDEWVTLDAWLRILEDTFAKLPPDATIRVIPISEL